MGISVTTGLEQLLSDSSIQNKLSERIGYLGHSCAVTHKLDLGLEAILKTLGKRVIKAFGPQHGFVTDVQDNMIESHDYVHPYFNIPIHSLYGETRYPTDKMLEGIDTLIVDLQDVGTRVYTYITTLALVMERCEKKNIKVVVLDRPNPVGGEIIEGPVLQEKWRSFVGHHPIPQRHGLTMGEVAKLQQKLYSPNCDLEVIEMKGWKRDYFWKDLNRTWVNPSPNLPTMESAITFCGTVLYEGTNISEGRGTTRSLEVLGAPGIEPFSFKERVMKELKQTDLSGFALRPLQFHPMFQKHSGETCGGVHIHPTEASVFHSWRLGAYLLKSFYEEDSFAFKWNDHPYEYETSSLAINYINGSEDLKNWVEKKGSYDDLIKIDQQGHSDFKNLREDILIYR
ncbi:MAG: DUF1343 domain-containing protein [Bacteriovoracaceae bacterium]|nr:DUF1343 domain-containing protein [Bacteriovoracaceae bacterium]